MSMDVVLRRSRIYIYISIVFTISAFLLLFRSISMADDIINLLIAYILISQIEFGFYEIFIKNNICPLYLFNFLAIFASIGYLSFYALIAELAAIYFIYLSINIIRKAGKVISRKNG